MASISPQRWGVIVADVKPDGPAAAAGLQIQDIVLTADDRRIETLPPAFLGSLSSPPRSSVEARNPARRPRKKLSTFPPSSIATRWISSSTPPTRKKILSRDSAFSPSILPPTCAAQIGSAAHLFRSRRARPRRRPNHARHRPPNRRHYPRPQHHSHRHPWTLFAPPSSA